LYGSVAIGNTSKVDIGVGVSSDKIEQTCQTLAGLSAAFKRLPACPFGIALNKRLPTRKISRIIPNMLKKALRKDPATTLPKFLKINLENGLEHCDSLRLLKLKYH
jgi:hypothetical protein